MSENLLRDLQHSADLALKSETVEEGVRHLSRAFTLFSEEASQLKSAYAKLQERFDTVNRELSKKAEEVGRATFFLNNILKNISEAILFVDLEGTVAMINDAGQKLLGFHRDRLLFQKFSSFFPDDHFGFSMKEALTFGISHRLLYKTIGGKELEISTTFVYEGPKAYHGLVILCKDISERQKFQLVLSRNDRLKELGEMAASVAHEIRNPLGGIRGFASLLFRDLAKEPHLQEMAASIIEGTKALEKLVSNVLHYTRPVQTELTSMELCAYLKEVGKFIRMDAAFPPNIRLEMHIPQTPLLAPIDPTALKSALLNLLFNAIQAMPQGGLITLSLLKLESSCQIVLSDTGIGMDEKMQESLFSPFFTTKQEGNGLGLVETQKIVHAHHGTIDVRSRPGFGTTFTLTLPLKR